MCFRLINAPVWIQSIMHRIQKVSILLDYWEVGRDVFLAHFFHKSSFHQSFSPIFHQLNQHGIHPTMLKNIGTVNRRGHIIRLGQFILPQILWLIVFRIFYSWLECYEGMRSLTQTVSGGWDRSWSGILCKRNANLVMRRKIMIFYITGGYQILLMSLITMYFIQYRAVDESEVYHWLKEVVLRTLCFICFSTFCGPVSSWG